MTGHLSGKGRRNAVSMTRGGGGGNGRVLGHAMAWSACNGTRTHSRGYDSKLLSTFVTTYFCSKAVREGSRICQLNNQTRHQSNDLAAST